MGDELFYLERSAKPKIEDFLLLKYTQSLSAVASFISNFSEQVISQIKKDRLAQFAYEFEFPQEDTYRKWTIAGSTITIYEINIQGSRAMLLERMAKDQGLLLRPPELNAYDKTEALGKRLSYNLPNIRQALHLTSDELFANFVLDVLHEQVYIEDLGNQDFSYYFENLMRICSDILTVMSKDKLRDYFGAGKMLPKGSLQGTLDSLPVTMDEFNGLVWLLAEADDSNRLYDPANIADKHRTAREIIAANAVAIMFERRNRQLTQGLINKFFGSSGQLAKEISVDVEYIEAFQDRLLATWQGYVLSAPMKRHPHNSVLHSIAAVTSFTEVTLPHPLRSPVIPKQFRNAVKIEVPPF